MCHCACSIRARAVNNDVTGVDREKSLTPFYPEKHLPSLDSTPIQVMQVP